MASPALTSVLTPQLVASTFASTLASNAAALPSHFQASRVLVSPIFPARLAAPSLAPTLPSRPFLDKRFNFQPRSLIFYKSLSLKGHRLVLMLPRLQASRWCSSRLLLTNGSCPKVLRPSQVKHKSFFQIRHFCLPTTTRSPVLVVLPRGHVSRVLFSPLPAPPRLPRVFSLPLFFSFASWQSSRGSQVSRCYSRWGRC